MKKKSTFYRLTLGLLIGALILPVQPQPAQAQFGGIVFDAKNYALQVNKRLEEAQRHVQTFNNAVRQFTTLRGILGQVDDLVAKQRNAINTMSNIGRTVRASLQLKDQVQAIVTTRLTMLKSIDDRLRSGIFDPEADMRDLEDYLRTSIGRSSQDSVANLERLRNMDNTLERMTYDLRMAQAALSKTQEEKIKWQAQLDVMNAKLESERDAISIASLIEKISSCETLIAQYTARIAELLNKIKERTEKYHALMDERIKFADQVHTTNEAWTELNNKLDEIQRTLGTY
jgi:chromosome segregation ATPase